MLLGVAGYDVSVAGRPDKDPGAGDLGGLEMLLEVPY
jgi:hypothetical protein